MGMVMGTISSSWVMRRRHTHTHMHTNTHIAHKHTYTHTHTHTHTHTGCEWASRGPTPPGEYTCVTLLLYLCCAVVTLSLHCHCCHTLFLHCC
jgi:hypothetical protein